MNYLNITKYIYLIVGFIMLYEVITKWNDEPKPWLYLLFAVAAFFTFFFRSKFAKRFDQQKNQQDPNTKS